MLFYRNYRKFNTDTPYTADMVYTFIMKGFSAGSTLPMSSSRDEEINCESAITDSDVAPPPIIKELLDVNLDMQQQIVQAELGVLVLEDWNGIDLGLVSGLRYYDQTIKIFGTIPGWHDNNALVGSFSWGHEESSRLQLVNTLTFRESWFTSLGWRRDEFVNDGVEIVESGLYFDIGKQF